MNWMEQRKTMLNKINGRLAELYLKARVADRECFKHRSGIYFRLFEFPGENALCIEYAENDTEAYKNRFEDGDRFFLEEYSEDEMLKAMIREIEET